MHEKLVLGLRSYASLRLLTQIASWLGSIYVIRQVGSHALGRYAVALVVFNYISMAYDGTLLEALIQRPPATPTGRRAAFTLVVAVGVSLSALTAAGAGAIGRLVGDDAVPALILGMALALALTACCVLPHATLARQMQFPRLATIGAVQAVCVTVVTVGLAWRGAGAWALVSGQIVGTAVRLVLLTTATQVFMRPTAQLRDALEYLRFGGVLFADNVLWRSYTSLDTFLLGRWSGTRLLGFYSLAQQAAELPLEKIATVVNDVSLPVYAELREDTEAAGQLLLETVRMHAAAGFPLYWGLAAVGSFVVPLLFGAGWRPTVFPLIALSAIAPLRLIGSIETPAMTGLGRPKVLIKTKLIIAPCMAVALIIGCRLGGINGAALAWLGMFPLCQGIAFRYVLHAAGVCYRQIAAVLRGPVSASAVMVATVLVWERGVAALSAPLWLRLAGAIAIGSLTYGAGLRFIDADAFKLVKRRLQRVVGLRQPA